MQRSRIDTANLCCFCHTRDCQHIGSQAHITGMLISLFSHSGKGAIHDDFQFLRNLFDTPEEALNVLHPFKVAHGDAASIRQDVRDDYDTLLEENFIGLRGRGAIGSLGNDLCLNTVGVRGSDDALSGRGNQDVTGNF